MKWRVVGSDGWRSEPIQTLVAARIRRDNANELASDPGSDLAGVKHRVVRLVSKREKLKESLLLKSEVFEQDALMHASSDRTWYLGYARALRDIAGQL